MTLAGQRLDSKTARKNIDEKGNRIKSNDVDWLSTILRFGLETQTNLGLNPGSPSDVLAV